MPIDEGNRKIVVVFRVKVRAGLERNTKGDWARLLLKGYAEPGGEKAYIIEWDNEESLNRWRNHPVHQEAMKEGREKLYAWYSVHVYRELRTSGAGVGVKRETEPVDRSD